LINAIELEAQEYGMKAYEVIGYNISRLCAYHNNERHAVLEGIKCSLEHELHSDLNGALNILKKATGMLIQGTAKPL